jgi:hypothetical protein
MRHWQAEERQATKTSADARDDFPWDLLRGQKLQIFTTTTKDTRITPFEPHHRAVLLRRFRQQPVDVVLSTRR